MPRNGSWSSSTAGSSTRTAWRSASDRDRDADLLDFGYETVRITWERLHETPEREAARLKRILARRERELGRAVS